MIAEALLTRIMRRKVGRILNFDMGSASAGSPSLPAADPQRSTLLYAHVPFCDELCPYCSFNRVRLDPNLARRYFTCLEHELELYSELGWRFNAIYVGGGTPTILPQQLAAFLSKARKLWPIRNISVETNPNHLTPAILSLLQECGVNRLSVGVQSFDDAILRAIGRYERYGSGREIAERLQDTQGRFDTLNADLIFNFPAQTERMFLRDLETVAKLDLDQVTFYPLMAASRVRGNLAKLGRIDPRQEKRLYMKIWDVLGERYEPSSAWCFSRRDSSPERRMIDEYIVEHSEYAGLGSGSFGYAGATIYANTFDITGYIDRLDRGTLPIAAARRFSRADRIRYDFLMRMFGGGIDLRRLESRHGGGIRSLLWKELLFLRLTGALTTSGRQAKTLALTRRGYYLWVILMREFFTGVNNFREQVLPVRGPALPAEGKSPDSSV